ncbi:hypothetical protein Plhal304r1_c008g0030931 [Plasmopara halstedii]
MYAWFRETILKLDLNTRHYTSLAGSFTKSGVPSTAVCTVVRAIFSR